MIRVGTEVGTFRILIGTTTSFVRLPSDDLAYTYGEYVLLANANINEEKAIEAEHLPFSPLTTLPETMTARGNIIVPKAILTVSSGKSAQSSSAVSEWALVTCEADCSPS